MPRSSARHRSDAESDRLVLARDYSWEMLASFFDAPRRACPPLYLFLSPESAGSLKGRDSSEIEFVHAQQRYGGAACLRSPPAAWVSSLDQIPEETGHLFILVHKPKTQVAPRSAKAALILMTWHECFGRFSELLIFGQAIKKTRRPRKELKTPENSLELWKLSHAWGYYFGENLYENLLLDKSSPEQLRRLFWGSWSSFDPLNHHCDPG